MKLVRIWLHGLAIEIISHQSFSNYIYIVKYADQKFCTVVFDINGAAIATLAMNSLHFIHGKLFCFHFLFRGIKKYIKVFEKYIARQKLFIGIVQKPCRSAF